MYSNKPKLEVLPEYSGTDWNEYKVSKLFKSKTSSDGGKVRDLGCKFVIERTSFVFFLSMIAFIYLNS